MTVSNTSKRKRKRLLCSASLLAPGCVPSNNSPRHINSLCIDSKVTPNSKQPQAEAVPTNEAEVEIVTLPILTTYHEPQSQSQHHVDWLGWLGQKPTEQVEQAFQGGVRNTNEQDMLRLQSSQSDLGLRPDQSGRPRGISVGGGVLPGMCHYV